MDKDSQDKQPELGRRRITERPDGVFWEDTATGEVAGPFGSVAEAMADMDYQADSSYEPGESLEEAASELGVAEWLDQDTGEPAEESVPRIRDR